MKRIPTDGENLCLIGRPVTLLNNLKITRLQGKHISTDAFFQIASWDDVLRSKQILAAAWFLRIAGDSEIKHVPLEKL